MDDDSRKTSSGDPIESRSQTVESNNDNDSSDDPSRWSAYTGSGFQSRSREGACGRIRAEARTDRVGDPDCNQLLVGVDFVSIDTAECYENTVNIPNKCKVARGR